MTMAISTAVTASPAPTVELSLSSLPTGTSSLIVTRSWASTVATVRQQVIPSGGAALVRDYAAPVGRAASWTVRALSSAGVVLESGLSGSVTVPLLADASQAWVMDELDPRSAMLMYLRAGTDAEVSYTGRADLSFPANGGDAVLLSSARRITGRPFVVRTMTAAEGDAFETMIRRGGALLFRPNPAMIRHRNGLITVAAETIKESPKHPYEGGANWLVDGGECAPDAWPDTVPLQTWAERAAGLAGGTTWASRKAASVSRSWLQRYQARV